jgi:hypothetical protein
MLELLKKFTENAYVNLLSGLILLATSGKEIIETLDEGRIGTHHGVAIFALLHILQVFPEIVHGTEQAIKIEESPAPVMAATSALDDN